MSAEAQAIEEFFRRRYGREAIYLPSGRLALFLAFQEWLRPGDLVLMSPVDDDVVFFTVLAAGLVPVLGPIDPGTGNIDPAAIPESTWARLRAVLTTNLYGIPDRMDLLEAACRRHGLQLIEDACHAFDSRFNGRRIGTFGKATAYSLSKHMGIAGGVLAFSEAGRRERLVQRAKEAIRAPFLSPSTGYRGRTLWDALGFPDRVPRSLARLRARIASDREGRLGHRMPYALEAVRQAQKMGGGLDRWDRWVRMDNPAYRTWPLRASVRASIHRLETFEENRRLRLSGTERLLELGYTPPGLPRDRDAALLRVPLFVEDREEVVALLARRGLGTEYIYDPPLDVYAAELAESMPSPSAARKWSGHVLPVNPLLAHRFLAIHRQSPERFQPLPDGG